MLFLEQNVYRPVGNRIDRFYDARGTRTCGVPWVIVDSGLRYTCGYEDFTKRYRTLVTEAMSTPAEAEIEGWFLRTDNDLRVHVEVTNRTGRTLGFANWPTINVLVYEEARVYQTRRFVRAAAQLDVDGLIPDGMSTAADIELLDVYAKDWAKAHVIALFDYRPEPTESRFVSAQAVEVTEGVPPTPSPVPTFASDTPKVFLPLAIGPR